MVLTRVLNSNTEYLVIRVEQEHNVFPILNIELNEVVEMIIGMQQQRIVIICTQVQKNVLTQNFWQDMPFIVYCVWQVTLLEESLPRQEGQSPSVNICRQTT